MEVGMNLRGFRGRTRNEYNKINIIHMQNSKRINELSSILKANFKKHTITLKVPQSLRLPTFRSLRSP